MLNPHYANSPIFRQGDLVYSQYDPEVKLRVTEVRKYRIMSTGTNKYTVMCTVVSDGRFVCGHEDNFRHWDGK